MVSKVVKNVVLLHKTSEVVFYRQQRSWWYHLSNSKHFFESRNNNEKFCFFAAAEVNGLFCTSELGEYRTVPDAINRPKHAWKGDYNEKYTR